MPLKHLSGQFLTFLTNFMKILFLKSYKRNIPCSRELSKLKLIFSLFGFCVKQIRSFGGGNAFYIYVICFYTKILCSLVFFPFLIIVISVNTFSFDTLGDLWCMYGIFIHLVMTPLATAHYSPPVLII